MISVNRLFVLPSPPFPWCSTSKTLRLAGASLSWSKRMLGIFLVACFCHKNTTSMCEGWKCVPMSWSVRAKCKNNVPSNYDQVALRGSFPFAIVSSWLGLPCFGYGYTSRVTGGVCWRGGHSHNIGTEHHAIVYHAYMGHKGFYVVLSCDIR